MQPFKRNKVQERRQRIQLSGQLNMSIPSGSTGSKEGKEIPKPSINIATSMYPKRFLSYPYRVMVLYICSKGEQADHKAET